MFLGASRIMSGSTASDVCFEVRDYLTLWIICWLSVAAGPRVADAREVDRLLASKLGLPRNRPVSLRTRSSWQYVHHIDVILSKP